MSDTAWPERNEQFLSLALAWLRLRLEQLAGQPPQPAAPHPAPAEVALPVAPGSRSWWRREPEPPPVAALPGAEPPPRPPVSAEELAAAEAAMHAAAGGSPPPALHLLGDQLGLSPFERSVLLLCAAMELDTRIGTLCARAHGDPARAYPTFGLAMALLPDPAWDVLSPDRPLRLWRLLEISQPGAQPLTSSPLRADERIVNYLKGLNYLDDRLRPLLGPLPATPPGDLPPSQAALVESALRQLAAAAPQGRLPVVQLLGADSASKHLVAAAIGERLGLHLYRLPAELLAQQAGDLDGLARLWQREAILLPLALYLDASEGDAPGEGRAAPLARLLARIDGVTFLDTREARPGLDREAIGLDVERPTAAEQRAAWAAALGLHPPAQRDGFSGPAQAERPTTGDPGASAAPPPPAAALLRGLSLPKAAQTADDLPARLAGQFNLGLGAIRQIAAAAGAAQGEGLAERAWELCLLHTRPRLDSLAQRIDVRAGWGDIVLPAADEELLRQIAGQVGQRGRVYEDWGFGRKMNRGLGISALFCGESGTGKTMAAEVIASDLRLNLYRIDLSQVVSKYIGETEKNLRRLFDAAEDGGAILFFDEADALFGKRSEVKDSHDRYANIEINYLLQRIESYRGLAILATNMKSALDPAFLRRLRFIVNFSFPSVAERRRIWARAFPQADPQRGLAGVPTDDLDYDHLARLNLAGGSIHNIALNAAFLAAQRGQPVTMPLVLEAARVELRKIERPINEADLRWQRANHQA